MEVAALRCDKGEIASTSHKTDPERGYRISKIENRYVDAADRGIG